MSLPNYNPDRCPYCRSWLVGPSDLTFDKALHTLVVEMDCVTCHGRYRVHVVPTTVEIMSNKGCIQTANYNTTEELQPVLPTQDVATRRIRRNL